MGKKQTVISQIKLHSQKVYKRWSIINNQENANLDYSYVVFYNC